MKFCNTCGKTKEFSEFQKRAASNDGLSAKCKLCAKAYDDARLRDPKRMEARRIYQKTKGREAHNRATKKWVEKNAIKRACHIMVGNAVKKGSIVVPDFCCECGSSESKLNGHHDDYAKPLSVRWLCDKCHNEWHKLNGEGLNAN